MASKPKKPKAAKKPKTPAAKPAPAAGDAPAAPKPSRKEVREKPGMGHNITQQREMIEPFTTRFLNLSEDMNSDMAGYRADFKNLYEEIANATGLKKSQITKELKRVERKKREAEAEAAMAADERETANIFRQALGGTQYEMFAAGELAPPGPGTGEAAKDAAAAADKEAEENPESEEVEET